MEMIFSRKLEEEKRLNPTLPWVLIHIRAPITGFSKESPIPEILKTRLIHVYKIMKTPEKGFDKI